MDHQLSTLAANENLIEFGQAPALVAACGTQAERRCREFFTVTIRNRNTRAAAEFCAFLEGRGVTSLAAIQPIQVAAYVEAPGTTHAPATGKQRLAALRMLFDWLVAGQVLPVNPAASVRGPKHIVKRGKTPVLERADGRLLLESIDTSTVLGLRDRAFIGLLVYSFARVGAAVAMELGDFGRAELSTAKAVSCNLLDSVWRAANVANRPTSPMRRRRALASP